MELSKLLLEFSDTAMKRGATLDAITVAFLSTGILLAQRQAGGREFVIEYLRDNLKDLEKGKRAY
jgi:hypothetical protein